jgi:membrane fusion protein (multidrug efflux system)
MSDNAPVQNQPAATPPAASPPAAAPAAPAAAAAATPASGTNGTRKRGLTLITVLVVLAGIGWGVWHWIYSRHQVNTDNAYVAGNVVQITPQVAGTVIAINADDTDYVRAGQPLVKLDPADARVALEQAQAQLAQTVREVRVLYANNATYGAQIGTRQADVTRSQADVKRTQADLMRAQADLAKSQDDVNRREPLVASGAVGKEEFQHSMAQLASASGSVVAAQAAVTAAQAAVAASQSGVSAANEQLAASQTQTDGTSVDQHPNVLRAAARVREAYLGLQRTELVAPIDGYIAKRGVQIGQRVQAGAPLMTLIALDQLWVDANFKESQLQGLRIGQPADMAADVYGKKVVYHGKVSGLGAGTGAAFALLPAQNATGNWIKVVQRVPVRIMLDPKELTDHPLRVGLSMDVTVDTQDQSGKSLSDTPRTSALASTEVFDAQRQATNAEVDKIIAASLGHKAKTP